LVVTAYVINSFHKIHQGFKSHQDYVNLVGRLWVLGISKR
jgi:hypothetical protein